MGGEKKYTHASDTPPRHALRDITLRRSHSPGISLFGNLIISLHLLDGRDGRRWWRHIGRPPNTFALKKIKIGHVFGSFEIKKKNPKGALQQEFFVWWRRYHLLGLDEHRVFPARLAFDDGGNWICGPPLTSAVSWRTRCRFSSSSPAKCLELSNYRYTRRALDFILHFIMHKSF